MTRKVSSTTVSLTKQTRRRIVYYVVCEFIPINLGFTGLMYAAMNGHQEICEMLLDHGADVNEKDNNGEI